MMEESLSEVRSILHRVRPLVLLHLRHGGLHRLNEGAERASIEPASQDFKCNGDNEHNDQNEYHDLQNELEMAMSELVDGIASLIWNLDCLWSDLIAVQEQGENGTEDMELDLKLGRDEKKENESINTGGKVRNHGKIEQPENGKNRKIHGNNNDTSGNKTPVEPDSEWNEEAKSLIRDGYALLLTTDTPQRPCQTNQNILTLVRNSILDLLPSLSTSACRHFLLEFLPHFLPRELVLGGNSGCAQYSASEYARNHANCYAEDAAEYLGQDYWCPPSWLVDSEHLSEPKLRNNPPPASSHPSTNTVVEREESIPVSGMDGFTDKKDHPNDLNETNHIKKGIEDGNVGSEGFGRDEVNEEEHGMSNEEESISRILSTFQSLIQTDASTLLPFLNTLSILFENGMPSVSSGPTAQEDQVKNKSALSNNDALAASASSSLLGDSSGDDKGNEMNHTSRSRRSISLAQMKDQARKECFDQCLSSLPSISEQDLPSLLHSVLSLVRCEDEGREVIEAVKLFLVDCTMELNNHDSNEHGKNEKRGSDKLCFIIGHVIVQHILGNNIYHNHNGYSSTFLANGFLNSLRNSLADDSNDDNRDYDIHASDKADFNNVNGAEGADDVEDAVEYGDTGSCAGRRPFGKDLNGFHADGGEGGCSHQATLLTQLDVVLMMALYSHPLHRQAVESIIDDLIGISIASVPGDNSSSNSHFSKSDYSDEKLLFFFHLVEKFIPGRSINRKSDGHSGSNYMQDSLFENLSSHVISLLFYTIVALACFGGLDDPYGYNHRRWQHLTLVGGLPGMFLETSYSTHDYNLGARVDARIEARKVACYTVMAKLYLAIDAERQRQIVNSLLSMMSASFVQCHPQSMQSLSKNKPKKDSESSSSIPELVEDINWYKSSLMAAACTACRTFIILSEDHCHNLSHDVKGILLDRLLSLASVSGPSILSTSSTSFLDYNLFDLNCAALVSLLQDSFRGDVFGGNCFIICQKLLFSTAMSEGFRHRVVCGLILSSRLLRCKHISRSERGNIWTWVLSVLPFASENHPESRSSSFSVSGGFTPLHRLDPIVSLWGLLLLKAASRSFSSSESTPQVSKMSYYMDVNPLYSGKDVFRQVKKMLANACLIQLEDSLKIPLSPSSSSSDREHSVNNARIRTFLAYTQIPPHFCKKAVASNAMVVSAPFYLFGDQSQSDGCQLSLANKIIDQPSIQKVASFVYELVDYYLELGRQKSSGALISKSQAWDPTGWLTAKVQFSCNLSNQVMEWLGIGQSTLELGTDLDDTTPPNTNLPQNDIIDNASGLLAVANSIVVTINVSCAVLKHAHDHFQAQIQSCVQSSKEFSSTKQNSEEAKHLKRKKKHVDNLRKLLQYQVAKIYSLKYLYSKVCKLMLTCDDAMTVGRERQLNSNSLLGNIHCSVLWNVLDDDGDDFLLLQAIRSTVGAQCPRIPSDVMNTVCHIFNLRNNILHHLKFNFIKWSSENSDACVDTLHNVKTEDERVAKTRFDDFSLHGLSNVFRMAMALSPMVNGLCQENKSFSECGSKFNYSNLRGFLSAHYKLLLAAFSYAARLLPVHLPLVTNIGMNTPRQKGTSTEKKAGSCFSDIVRSCANSGTLTFGSNDKTCLEVVSEIPNKEKEAVLISNLIQLLNECEDASMACHLVDLISLLELHSRIPSKNLLSVTKDALISIYKESEEHANLPYSFFVISHTAKSLKEHPYRSAQKRLVSDSFTSFHRAAISIQKTKDPQASIFIHFILSHWSALVCGGESQVQYVTELKQDLISANAEPSHQSNSTKIRLNRKTFVFLYEILLHMVVASLSLFKPHQSTSKKKVIQEGPYDQVNGYLEVFGDILSHFRIYHSLLPRRVFFSVIKASLQIIKLCDFHIKQCVLWRSSKKMFSGMGAGPFAGLNYLQALIDCIASRCVGSIILLCRELKELVADEDMTDSKHGSAAKRVFSSISSPDNPRPEYFYKQTKVINGLLYRCEGIKQTIQCVCQSHHLILLNQVDEWVVPGNGNRVDGSTQGRRKRIRRSFGKEKLKSILESVPDSNHGKNDDVTQKKDEYENVKYSDSSDEEQTSGEEDEGSFGAVGDWIQ